MPSRTPRLLTLLATVALFAGVTPSLAQNFEGPGLLRFGVYGATTHVSSDYSFANTTNQSADFSRAGVGVSFGYDWRMDRFLVGAEADVTTVSKDLKLTPGDVSIDYLSTFRGRLGYFARPGLLIYGTAGLGLANTSNKPSSSGSDAGFMTGWVAGGGLEYDWNNVVFFGEYLRAGFGNDTVTLSGTQTHLNTDADMFRLGLKMKIGFDY